MSRRLNPLSVAVLLLMCWSTSSSGETVPYPGPHPTLQATLDAAAPGSVVQVAPGHYTERLRLGAQHAVTLRGDPANPGGVVLDGGGIEDTIRMVDVGPSMRVEGLTVVGGTGNAGYGGGLFMANSSATFRACEFRDNLAALDGGGVLLLNSAGLFEDCVFRGNRAGTYGGGVMVNLGSTTVFDGCVFADNETGTTNPALGSGGGVHVNDSSPTFTRCIFQNNRAPRSGAGVLVLGHFDAPRSNVTFQECTIVDNVASGVPGSLIAEGGGIHVEDNVRAVVDRSVVRGNVAHLGGGLNTYRAVLEVRDSIVEGNVVTLVPEGGGFGGGIGSQSVNVVAPAQPPAVVRVVRSLVRENAAVVGGGIFAQGDFVQTGAHGVLEIEDSVISANTASQQGGGLKVDRMDATIRRSMILGNRVTAVESAFGGGLVSAAGSSATIVDSTFVDNRTGSIGGAIYADQGGTLVVSGSRFYFNTASSELGAGGGAIGVGQAAGPLPGPVGGAVEDSEFASNGDRFDIWEADCDLAMWSTIGYRRNRFLAGASGIYYRACQGGTATGTAFDALGAKADASIEAEPVGAAFLAAPAHVLAGGSSQLAWVVPDATALAITPGVGDVPAPFGTVDVAPSETTTYGLFEGSSDRGSATVEVDCAALRTPVPFRPSNGSAQRPGATTLEWLPAAGAVSYDVYLDETAEPAQRIATGVTETTLAVAPLVPGREYRWRVVASSPACASPVAGPTFAFTTCTDDRCAVGDGFDDGDASDWTLVGRGRSSVDGGALLLRGKPRLLALAPLDPMEDGTTEVRLRWLRGRRLVRVLFAYQDGSTYRELAIAGGRRWKLGERIGGQLRWVAKGKRPVAPGPVTLWLAAAGSAMTAGVDGETVLQGDFGIASRGKLGIESVGTGIAIDSVTFVPAATP